MIKHLSLTSGTVQSKATSLFKKGLGLIPSWETKPSTLYVSDGFYCNYYWVIQTKIVIVTDLDNINLFISQQASGN